MTLQLGWDYLVLGVGLGLVFKVGSVRVPIFYHSLFYH